ncbi:MAG: carboxypeptidase-like regulatory domain-containing protein [Pseudomonadota bacterium]
MIAAATACLSAAFGAPVQAQTAEEPATAQFAIGNSASAAGADSWQANDDDFLLLDIRSGQFRLGDGVRGYVTDRGVCVDFADVIMALDIPVRLNKKSRRATGWIFAEEEILVVDRDQNMVQIMNKSQSLNSGDIYDTPEGWCIDTRTLSRWLSVDLTPDLSNALLLLTSERKLPFQRAAERKARAAKIRPVRDFDLADLPQADQPYSVWQTPSVDAVVSVGGLRDAQRNRGQFDVRYELFASGEIGKASVDARLASDNDGVPNSLRVRAYRADPSGEMLGPLKATQVAVGDVATISTPLVAQSVIGRGALITNRPLQRPDTFDRTSFRGSLPLGWDAELYRNGQLLAFTENRADGRYEFIDVPLLFGVNDFEVVLYGPQGQIRREKLSLPVGQDSIPPGETYYWVGGNQAGRDLVTLRDPVVLPTQGWRGTFGLEHGIDERTSVSAAFHSLRIFGRRSNIFELSGRRALGKALIDISAASDVDGNGAIRGQFLGQFGQSFVRAETIWGNDGFRSDQLQQNVTGRQRLSVTHFFKAGKGTIPAEFEAVYRSRNTGNDTLEVSSRLSYAVRNVSLTSEVQWIRNTSRFGPDPDDIVDTALLANLRLGKLRLRGESRFRLSPDSRFQSATLVGEWRQGSRANWRAELGFDAGANRTRIGLGYIRQFDKFSLNGSVEAATDGSFAAGLNLAFSLGPDPRNGRLRFSNERLATNGQVMATVFRDLNADGIRQRNEPLEADVELTAGRAVALTPTDDRGRALIDGLQPFQPVLVGIDAGRLPDPYLQPAGSGVVVTPRPGVAARVELPLVAAGEVDGTLVSAGGAGIGGVTLELLDVEGRVQVRTQTEFDGFFLFDRVPYGRYSLRIEKLSADAIEAGQGLRTPPVVLDDAEPLVNLGAVRIHANARTIAGNGVETAGPQ